MPSVMKAGDEEVMVAAGGAYQTFYVTTSLESQVHFVGKVVLDALPTCAWWLGLSSDLPYETLLKP